MKIFLISPVRNVSEQEREKIKKYVTDLENADHLVHWPERNTDQNDRIGLRICTDNREAIEWAEEIHIWWQWQENKWWQKWMWWVKEKKSTGSLFDFGMGFALAKKIILANPEEVQPTSKKSFNNVLLKLHRLNREVVGNE